MNESRYRLPHYTGTGLADRCPYLRRFDVLTLAGARSVKEIDA